MKKFSYYKILTYCSLLLFVIGFQSKNFALSEESKFATAANLVKEKNYLDAFVIFEELAQTNDHEAQFNTAIFLKKGVGHPANYALSLKWAWLAKLGGVEAASNLIDEIIEFIPEDAINKIRFDVEKNLLKRMENGDTQVILQMSEFYRTIAEEPDLQKSYALGALAAALDVKGATIVRDELEALIDGEQLILGQGIAKELFQNNKWDFQ